MFAQDERGDYHEWTHLGVLMTGLLHAPHWASKPQPADFYALKGVVEHLLHELGIGRVSCLRRARPSAASRPRRVCA